MAEEMGNGHTSGLLVNQTCDLKIQAVTRDSNFNSLPSLSHLGIEVVTRLLRPPVATGTHCLLPDNDVSLEMEHRRSRMGETSGKEVLKLCGTSSRNSEFEFLILRE